MTRPGIVLALVLLGGVCEEVQPQERVPGFRPLDDEVRKTLALLSSSPTLLAPPDVALIRRYFGESASNAAAEYGSALRVACRAAFAGRTACGGLKKVQYTQEGGRVTTYFLLSPPRVVTDFSADPYGPPGVLERRVTKVELGWLKPSGTWVPMDEHSNAARELLLRCIVEHGDPEYF
jgi:hypothetical protein